MLLQKMVCILFVFNAAAQPLFCQAKINYGNNTAAGKYYTIRGMKMYCETYGDGNPLLLIHGNGGNISAFATTIPGFAQKYKVIATDSRAQGKSTDSKDSLSFEMMADDESALLDSMHIKAAYVIGWSDGGIVALLLAMRHPGKVIKLVSTGANLWPDSTAIIPSAWKEEKAYYETAHARTFTTPKEKNDWKIFMLDWLQPNIPLSELQKIQCPSLIIGGDHDVITLEHAVLIYQHIPQAYLWILPNSGHATLIEHKDEFNGKVADFFEQPFHERK
jgi:pimeloyl-ACP methyl ester carboxylesterase